MPHADSPDPQRAPEPPGTSGANPLAGVRVLDLSQTLPGPFCTQVLADLGADVLKVEPPAGDMTRHSPTGIFYTANRNKRSLVIDLKQPEGLATCLRLAEGCDVFVEGFRPGVVDRLGVGYQAVARLRPGVVYCSISGYGQHGPLAKAPGHDLNYLAASGALAFSGSWRRPGPQRPGLPVADLSTSLYAAVSIVAALRLRDLTGQGAHLDIALADCATAWASVRGDLFPTNDLFGCADGHRIALGVVEEHFWRGLCQAAGSDEPRLHDLRFATEPGRREHGDELSALLDELFLRDTAESWVRRLGANDVPVQRVLPLGEAMATPQTVSRGLVQTHQGQRHMTHPVVWDGQPATHVRHNPPALGSAAPTWLA
jgi:crotonobetainyl-CoA:carnitine CoA-transferase CaiB-like acyl-CoA transferase